MTGSIRQRAASAINEPEEEGEDDADDDAGCYREIKREALAADGDVAWEVAKTEPAQPGPQQACCEQDNTGDNEQRSHVKILARDGLNEHGFAAAAEQGASGVGAGALRVHRPHASLRFQVRDVTKNLAEPRWHLPAV